MEGRKMAWSVVCHTFSYGSGGDGKFEENEYYSAY